MSINNRAEIEWAPKVSLAKIRVLDIFIHDNRCIALEGQVQVCLPLLGALSYYPPGFTAAGVGASDFPTGYPVDFSVRAPAQSPAGA